MSKRSILKLALTIVVLAGALSAARPARAALGCSPICCNPSCTSVRQCFGHAGSCICQAFCTISSSGID